jgi:hypothetical protein
MIEHHSHAEAPEKPVEAINSLLIDIADQHAASRVR